MLDYELASGQLTTESADHLLTAVSKSGAMLQWVLDMHAHADQLSAIDYIRSKTGARYGIGARIGEVRQSFAPLFNATDVNTPERIFDELFEDGAQFNIGSLAVRVMGTPEGSRPTLSDVNLRVNAC